MTKQTENFSLPRFLFLTIISLIIFYLVFLIWDSDVGYMYRKHFTSNSHLKMDFGDLKGTLTENDIKARYHLNWGCTHENALPDFGDYICYDELNTWNGLPALNVVFWFKNGKLANAKIDFPLWAHQAVIAEIKKVYGAPSGVSKSTNNAKLAKNLFLLVLTQGQYQADRNILEDNLGVWYVGASGQLSTGLESDSNLLSHNTILWQSK